MKFPHFFIARPIFAIVLSLLMLLAGGDRVLAAATERIPCRHATDGAGDGQLSRR